MACAEPATGVQLGTNGAREAAAWLTQLGIDASATPRWYVEITLRAEQADAAIDLNVYPEEWGLVFRWGARVSSIRVTDIPFVHGEDDHRLLAEIPELKRFDDLLFGLERRYDFRFLRSRATVSSNLPRASACVRPWLVGQR